VERTRQILGPLSPEQKTKVCSKCLKPLPATEEYFGVDNAKPDGLRPDCRRCRTRPSNNNKNSRDTKLRSSDKKGRDIRKLPGDRTDKLSSMVSMTWPGLLFVGGFTLSCINGIYSLFDSAAALSSQIGFYLAPGVAFTLTLGTALTALEVFKREHLTLMILFFLVLQGLNLTINYQGVQKRLSLAHSQAVSQANSHKIKALDSEIMRHREFINLYPTTDKRGRPVSWKPEITKQVLESHKRIRDINIEITGLEYQKEDTADINRMNLIAWLLVPELCMIAGLLILSNKRTKIEQTVLRSEWRECVVQPR